MKRYQSLIFQFRIILANYDIFLLFANKPVLQLS